MYKISVKGYTNATNEENVRINTNYSNAVEAYKLATPSQPVIKNGKFTFSTVTFSTDMAVYPYQLEYGGYVTDFAVAAKEAAYIDLADAVNYKALQDNNNIFYSSSSNKGLVRIRAIGDSVHLTSEWSSAAVDESAFVYGQQLETPNGVNVIDGVITWNPVRNAKGYHIYLQFCILCCKAKVIVIK